MRGMFSTARNALKSVFVRNIMETFATRVLLLGLGLVTTVIIARILGPEGRGLIAVAMTIGIIGTQFGHFGLHASNTYYVARDKSLLPTLMGNSLMVSLIVGGTGAAIAWIVFTIWPTIAPLEGILLFLALGWIPFGLANQLLQNLLLGIHEVRAFNIVQIIQNVMILALLGIIIYSDHVSVLYVFSASFIALLAVVFSEIFILKSHLDRFPKPSMDLFRRNIGYGTKAYLTNFFSVMTMRVDVLMIKYILQNDEQTGYYAVAVTLCSMLYVFPTVVGTIIFPRLSSSQNPRERWNVTFKTSLAVGAIMFFVCIGVLFLGKFAIILLFGKEFEPSYSPLMLLCIGVFVWSIESIFRKLLNTDPVKGYSIEVTIMWAIVFPSNIALNLFLIPRYGINGAAIASSICLTLVGICVLFLAFRERKKLFL